MGSVAAVGVVLSGVCWRGVVHRVVCGPPGAEVAKVSRAGKPLQDLTRREWAVVLPMLVMIVIMGVYPQPFLRRIEPAVDHLVHSYYASVTPVPFPAGGNEISFSTEEIE